MHKISERYIIEGNGRGAYKKSSYGIARATKGGVKYYEPVDGYFFMVKDIETGNLYQLACRKVETRSWSIDDPATGLALGMPQSRTRNDVPDTLFAIRWEKDGERCYMDAFLDASRNVSTYDGYTDFYRRAKDDFEQLEQDYWSNPDNQKAAQIEKGKEGKR